MLYISDIYNQKTEEHLKHLDFSRFKFTDLLDTYWVELRDCITGEQVTVCRPTFVYDNKYRTRTYGVVTASKIRVMNKSFINLLSYLDVERISSYETIPNDAIIATEFSLKNTDCLWYNQITEVSSGRRKVKYFDLFEFLVAVQKLHPENNLYGVGIKHIKLMHGIVVKVTIKKDLTAPITKYMIRR